MSAERLREAAALMRSRAEAAQHADAKQPGRWMTEHHNSQHNAEPETCHIAEDRAGHYWTVAHDVYIPNAEHMAGMDPFTTLRVADWLDEVADRQKPRDRWGRRSHGWTGARAANAVADAYLGASA